MKRSLLLALTGIAAMAIPSFGSSLDPWSAIAVGSVQSGPNGISSFSLLANGFDCTCGLAGAVVEQMARQQMTMDTVVAGGGGVLSFAPGTFLTLTGQGILGPVKPNTVDIIEIGGGGFAVPFVWEMVVPDDDYFAKVITTAFTHKESQTTSDSDSGPGGAAAGTVAAAGPNGAPPVAFPVTSIAFSGYITVTKNGGPAESLFDGGLKFDNKGQLTTNGSIQPGDVTIGSDPRPGFYNFSLTTPLSFSSPVADGDSFLFEYYSRTELLTRGIGADCPEPGTLLCLGGGLIVLGRRWRARARTQAHR